MTTEIVLIYLGFAIFLFFVNFCSGASTEGRFKGGSIPDSVLVFVWKKLRDGFRLLIHDFFGLYCPWSWRRARRYRLADLRIYLGDSGQHHQTLGHINAQDCDDPQLKEVIARQMYTSRLHFWSRSIFQFLVGPIGAVLSAVFGLLTGLVLLKRFVFRQPTNW